MYEENSASRLVQMERLRRGKQIIEGKTRTYRADGYVNMLNKYGTPHDNSQAYHYTGEPAIPDMDLTEQYETNGLFSKIIDMPAEEAVKHGFDLGLNDAKLDGFVEDLLDSLDWEERAATAIKWARLYGGAIIVMLIDDGRGIDEPLDWNNIRGIDELRVYERAIVQPDYSSLYNYDPRDPVKKTTPKFGMPEYYQVFSAFGSFTVHESRCLIFRNGILPEYITQPFYRFWGMPEYAKIKRALRETVTAHGDGVKLLERSVQAIYKMKDLAQLLTTDEGEEKVLRRLQVIDMARGILNSIAIDNDGEDYDFKTLQLTGVKDVIDATCNMLSALTSIPQTILFGRSPAGENSTGTSDLENYYNFVERIQKLMLKVNLRTLLEVAFRAGLAQGKIDAIPDYRLAFSPLWSLSETEQANVEQIKAATALTKAQAAQIYVDMQAIDPTEIRKALAKSDEFTVEEILDEMNDTDLEWGVEEPDETEPDSIAELNSSGYNDDGSDDGDWITMNGTHVLVGEGGTIKGGPPNLKGAPYRRKVGSEPSKSGETKSESLPKKEYHPIVSDTDRKNLTDYAKRNKHEAPEIVSTHQEIDKLIREKYGKSQMTTEEFIQKSMEASEKWSDEDRMLDASYTTPIVGKSNPLEIEYSELNRKLREGDSLTDDESAVVDHFKRCAEPLGKDTDLYRFVGKDYVASLLGHQIELPPVTLFQKLDDETVGQIKSLEGKEMVNDALQSTCIGANTAFSLGRVAVKIKTPKDIPVCLTSDVSEGEIVIPAGARMRVVSAEYIQPPSMKNDTRLSLPKWKSIRGDRAVRAATPHDAGLTSEQQYFSQGVYIEMELLGYEN